MAYVPLEQAPSQERSLSPGAGLVLAATISLSMWWGIARLIGVA